MKLHLYSLLMQAAELVLAALHGIERPFRALRVWAWTQATKENLRQINSRNAQRYLN